MSCAANASLWTTIFWIEVSETPRYRFDWDGHERLATLWRIARTGRKRKVLEFVPPKGVGEKEASRAARRWNFKGIAPRWLKISVERSQKLAPPRGRSPGAYVPGQSCTQKGMEHEYEDRGTYLKCVRCKSTKRKAPVPGASVMRL